MLWVPHQVELIQLITSLVTFTSQCHRITACTQVLRGASEQLRDGGARGNPQFQPSSPAFDSGLDVPPERVKTAGRLVIWAAKLATHVLPVAVVTVRKLQPGRHVIAACVDGVDPGTAEA